MFNDLLDKTKGFQYQITLKVELKKYKGTETEFPHVCFNSTTKAVINDKFGLHQSFREILYNIDNWNKALVGLLNQSSLSALTFWLLDQ